MKLFVAYLFICAIAGVILRKRAFQDRIWILLGICVLVSIGYFFFNQI